MRSCSVATLPERAEVIENGIAASRRKNSRKTGAEGVNEGMSKDAHSPDPAAVFGAASSLWVEVKKRAAIDGKLKLSEAYNGMDELMRQVVRIASEFEAWACASVVFDELDDVWPYMLEDRFGEACLSVFFPDTLADFGQTDCLRVAWKLRLPIKIDAGLPVPVDVVAPNPVPAAAFREFRIQTVRNSSDGEDVLPFTSDDEPFDEELGDPYFALSGVGEDGLLEHIADRSSYSAAVELACKLAPGIAFPVRPFSRAE